MVIPIVIIILISFILSLWSLRDFRGEKNTAEIRRKLKQERIKGGIVFMKNRKVKHYFS
ncbi:MAG: hypothetical protein AAB893_04690 [Patescibacteria group bacterium]